MKTSKHTATSLLSVDYSNELSIVAAVEEIWDNKNNLKFQLEAEWFQNIAWYMGFQNLVWMDRTKQMDEPMAPSWRVRLVVNHLVGMIRTIGAKLYKNAPEWDVLPATTDALDLQTAQVANQLLQANWYHMGMDEKSLHALLWMLITGNAFIQHTWDPDAGPAILVPTAEGNVEPLDDEDLNIGETAAEVVSPFQMIIDPRVDHFKDAAYCMRSRVTNIDELKEDFPRAGDIKPEGLASAGLMNRFAEHIRTLTRSGTRGIVSQTGYQESTNSITVHELWIRPRKKSRGVLKRGRYVVCAGGKVLNGGGKGVEFPYLHGELPFSHWREIIVPGRPWATSTLEQLKPLQANYNRTKSQIVENRNLMSKPKWLVPKGSGLADNALTSEPGEIVPYNLGLKPEMTQPPQLPSYVQNMLVHDKQDMEDISGVHEVSRAEAPGQIRSGRGVLALVEQDESRQILVVKDIEFQIERLGRQNLSVSAQYVSERRMAKIVGENDELLLFSYEGADIIGNNAGLPGVNYFDVRVRTRSGFPLSRAAQQELLSSLIQVGVLQPAQNPADRELVMKLLSLGTVQAHLDESRVHRSRQFQEIERIIAGEEVHPEQWHAHSTHLEVLNQFRNSARYDTLDPQIKAKLEGHSKAHKEWIAINAVEPELYTRKAAMAAMVHMQMGQTAQAAQNEGSNLLAGGPSNGQRQGSVRT